MKKISAGISAALAIAAHSEVFTLLVIVAWIIVGIAELMKGISK